MPIRVLVLGRLSVSFFHVSLLVSRETLHARVAPRMREKLLFKELRSAKRNQLNRLLRASQRFGPWGARKWSLPSGGATPRLSDACEAQTQSNRDCGRGPQLYLECHTPRPSAVEPSGRMSVAESCTSTAVASTSAFRSPVSWPCADPSVGSRPSVGLLC